MPVGSLDQGLAQLNQGIPHSFPPPVVASAGTTQAGATLLPYTLYSAFRVTASASTSGVRLPPVQTWLAQNGGGPILVIPPPTVGFKLYPAAGEGLKAAATNAAVVIASGKATYVYPVGNGVGSSTAYRWALSA